MSEPTLDVSIPDADGVDHPYAVGSADRGNDLIAFAVRRLDGERPSYRVGRSREGWRCSCDDSIYRSRKLHKPCKHVAAIRRLFAIPEAEMATKKKTNDAGSPPGDSPAPIPSDAPTPEKAAPRNDQASAAVATPFVQEDRPPDASAVALALAAPFDPSEVKFKAQTVSGNRALAVPFVDARVIQDRLDDVLTVMGWQDSYECLPDGSVVCRLKIRVGGEWITKEDVGGQSEQPDEGDRRKAAFSDSLKRAAVKFGIGRYLYRQKPQWVDYDSQKRQFTRQPVLAATQSHRPAPPVEQSAVTPASQPAAPASERMAKLKDFDGRLAAEHLCVEHELLKHVCAELKKKGHDKDSSTWGEKGWELAWKVACNFERQRLIENVASLLETKGQSEAKAVATAGPPVGSTLAAMSNAQLRATIAWLLPMRLKTAG